MTCPRCKREVDPWPLQRADVCSPRDWAFCIRQYQDIEKAARRIRIPRYKEDKLREQENPEVLGYVLDRRTLTPMRTLVDTTKHGDHGADPVGDGTYRMVPSGDIVNETERNRRLAK